MIYIVAMVLLMIWGFFISQASMPQYKVGDWLKSYKHRKFPDQGLEDTWTQVIDINKENYLLRNEDTQRTAAFDFKYVESTWIKVDRR